MGGHGGEPDDTDGWRHENHLLQIRCNDLTARVKQLEAENKTLRAHLARFLGRC